MNRILFASTPLPEAEVVNALNVQNGNDAEILVASMLISALNAEVKWGSRNEDGGKIDLLLSFDHPWESRDRTLLMVQVKSGASYGQTTTEGFKLYKRTFVEVNRSINNIMLIWLDQHTAECWWAYIRAGQNAKITNYGANHLVTPAVRFEIARYMATGYTANTSGAKGIIIDTLGRTTPIKELRAVVKPRYRGIGTVKNPLVGEIAFTKLGWTYMFRESRRKTYKKQSSILIPYLKTLIKRIPSKYWVHSYKTYQREDFEFRQYEYVFQYLNVITNTGVRLKIIVRIIEETGYPKNWRAETLLSQKIVRKVVFKSCHYKVM